MRRTGSRGARGHGESRMPGYVGGENRDGGIVAGDQAGGTANESRSYFRIHCCMEIRIIEQYLTKFNNFLPAVPTYTTTRVRKRLLHNDSVFKNGDSVESTANGEEKSPRPGLISLLWRTFSISGSLPSPSRPQKSFSCGHYALDNPNYGGGDCAS